MKTTNTIIKAIVILAIAATSFLIAGFKPALNQQEADEYYAMKLGYITHEYVSASLSGNKKKGAYWIAEGEKLEKEMRGKGYDDTAILAIRKMSEHYTPPLEKGKVKLKK